MSVRQRLFARSPGPGTPGRRPISEKPLPRDPLSKPKSRPASRHLDDTLVAEQNHADPSTAKHSRRNSIMPRVLNRAKSCSALVEENGSNTTNPSPPRTPSRLTRKLSRPFLPKRSVSDKTDTHNRPSTAPAQTLKTRSASIEQLKSLWANGRPRTQQSMGRPPPAAAGGVPPPSRPQTSQRKSSLSQPNGPDNMKDQISHFLKTDRVVEAWDNIAKTANCCGTTLAKTKEWPSSIFRTNTKSSENLHGSHSHGGRRAPGSGHLSSAGALERQMSWTQEPEFLSTYSFKQRPEISPRIHVLSIAIDEELEKSFDMRMDGKEDVGGETGSIITALPAVPVPVSVSVPAVPGSMTSPRTVGALA